MIKIGGQKSLQPEIVTYPSYGFPAGKGSWLINVFGHVFQSQPLNLRQKMLVKMLANVMKASESDLQSSTFKNRVGPFFVEPLWRQKIQLEIAGKSFLLKKKSRRNGQFNNWVRLDEAMVRHFLQRSEGNHQAINFCVTTTHPAAETVECSVELLKADGLSIISDIDDTIKDSNVLNRRELLMNTFVRDFRCVEGMSEVYRQWFDAGVDFHYVSSSPWQLLESLQQMQTEFEFPEGSMHLRNFRLRDQFLKKLMFFRRKGKATEIKKLIQNLPQRKFILIGDSGEKDPEIYLRICRKFPHQIKGVFIRDIGGRELLSERLRKIHRSTPIEICTAFRTSEELFERSKPIVQRYGLAQLAN